MQIDDNQKKKSKLEMYKDSEKKRCAFHTRSSVPRFALICVAIGSVLHSDVVSGGREMTILALSQLPRVCTEAFGVRLERVGFFHFKHTE